MSDRLAELQRQRALAQEQLAWFDREIAQEAGATPVTAAPWASFRGSDGSPAPTPTIPVVDSVAQVAAQAAAARAADDILTQYEKNPQNAAQDAKRGCFLWFAAAMGLLVLIAVAIYVVYR